MYTRKSIFARGLLLLLLATVPAALVAAPARPADGPETQSPATTVFLVRHAEKAASGDPEFDPSNASDPPLNAAGRERAEALARTLEEAGVTAIFASQFERTQATVASLAEQAGVAVQVHSAADVAGLAALVRSDHAGGVVVIAGHSNTVPALVEALGADPVAAIEDAWEYDNLYVVTVSPGGSATVRTLKFGAPSLPGR